MTNKPIFIIVDGNSFIHRAFHAFSGLSTASGFPTNAISGSLTMMSNLIRDYNPDKFVVAFDAKGKNFRHEMFKDYKCDRPPTDPDLALQFPVIKNLVSYWGAPTLEVEGVEADDSISSLAVWAASEGYFVIVATSDKDMKQIVNENIHMLDTKDSNNKSHYGREGVFEKEGVYPEGIIDKLALMGDKSDSIPGVYGCGNATALKWLKEYGTVENVIANADSIKGKIGETLRDSFDILKLSKRLVTIDLNVKIPVHPNDYKFNPNNEKLLELLNHYELNKLKTLLNVKESKPLLKTTISTDIPFADFYSKKALYLDVFLIDEENHYFVSEKYDSPVYWFKESNAIEFLKVILDRKITICSLNGKEVLKSISRITSLPVSPFHIVHDARVADYVTNGGKSSEVTISYLNNLYSKLELSPLRLSYKLDDKTPQYKKMAIDEIIKVKAEELSLCSYLFASKCFDTKTLAYQTDTKLLPILSKMEVVGSRVDLDSLNKFGLILDSKISKITDDIFLIAGQEFNIASPKQVGNILFDVLDIPSKKKSTAEKELKKLVEEYPIIQMIFDFRSLSKLKSTYVVGLTSRAIGDRVHTTYKQTVATTGRLTSTDPNLQNIPIRSEDGKKIREAFIPREYYKIVALDYSQVELRVLAHIAKEPNLINAFVNGEDIHRATASMIMGIPIEEVSDEARRNAKAINFGLIYGLSANNLAKELGILAKEAKEYYETYFIKFNMIKPYFEGVLDFAKENLFVETEFGRRLPVKDVNSSNGMIRSHAQLAAKNAPIQGTAADIIKYAMIEVAKDMENSNDDAVLLMQVHDELVFEVHESIADDFALKMQKIMSTCVTLDVPLVVDYKVADNWLDAH